MTIVVTLMCLSFDQSLTVKFSYSEVKLIFFYQPLLLPVKDQLKSGLVNGYQRQILLALAQEHTVQHFSKIKVETESCF